jgi:hypothetical protein
MDELVSCLFALKMASEAIKETCFCFLYYCNSNIVITKYYVVALLEWGLWFFAFTTGAVA